MNINQRSFLTRRKFCGCCIGIAAMSAAGRLMTPEEAKATTQNIVDKIRAAAATSTITTYKLRGNIVVLEGSGGNIGVLTGKDDKLLVDAGITSSRPRIMDALNMLNANPIHHLINTHWHFDHTDGNTWLNGEGAVITSHENTRKHLATQQSVTDWNFTFPPTPAAGLPTKVFANHESMHINGTSLALDHFAAAHTDSDITVHFEEPDVLHVADIYWNSIYPFIDYSTGGSILGTIAATNRIIAKTTDTTIIIPGHGYPVSNRAELIEYRDMLVEIYENVSKLKRRGMSIDETIAAKPTAAYDAKWGQFVITPSLFTRLVYEGT